MPDAAIDLRSQDDDYSEIFLACVDYQIFWDKVKLVGYQMDLKPDHMDQIKDDINLDTDLLSLTAKRNATKEMLCDEEFGFKDGKHDPYKLLLLGFLYCRV